VTLEAVVLRLVRFGLSRCGAGWGKYPWGVRDTITELLPLVDQNYRERNGYGEQGKTIAESIKDFDARLDRRPAQ